MYLILCLKSFLTPPPASPGLSIGYVIFDPEGDGSKLIQYLQQYPQIFSVLSVYGSHSDTKLSALVSSLK